MTASLMSFSAWPEKGLEVLFDEAEQQLEDYCVCRDEEERELQWVGDVEPSVAVQKAGVRVVRRRSHNPAGKYKRAICVLFYFHLLHRMFWQSTIARAIRLFAANCKGIIQWLGRMAASQ